MSKIPFRDGHHFRVEHLKKSALPGLVTAALVMLYLRAVLQFDGEGWTGFVLSVAVASVLLTPLGRWAAGRMERDIVLALDREVAGEASLDDIHRAYRAASTLPINGMYWYFSNWIIAMFIVPPVMSWWVGGLSNFAVLSICVAALTGGLSVAPFVYYSLRSLVEPLRKHWADVIDLEERAARGLQVPLRRKLLFPIAVVSASIVVFLCLLAYSLASRPVELQDLRVKGAYLAYATEQLRTGQAGLAELSDQARGFHVAQELFEISADSGNVLGGRLILDPYEIARVLEFPDGGESGSFDSDHSFAWVPIPDESGRILVAATHDSAFGGGLGSVHWIFIVVFIAAVGYGLATAKLLVRDIVGTSELIKSQAEQIAAGDLTRADVIESEDELGELALTFAHMKRSLRETIAGVSAAAGGVDSAAAELAEIGGGVAGNSAEQVRGIERATSHVADINRAVSEITNSSHVLSGSVEEASSSVLELGAAGEQLHSTAQALNSQVEEVTTSIEQMVRSVNAVGENTEGLSEAVAETSASMSEMARSMQEVQGHAMETQKLSAQVIDFAEGGRLQVQETIKGMDEIRDATESADQVIRGLTGRMGEIGAIVDVIDDVADETNLLALNAAIIAAQSGEQGRAFSVVADEIKDLADRVLSSTKEIGSLISGVQKEGEAAAQAVARGSERVQEGVNLSAQAGLALEDITAAARGSGDRIQEIVAAVLEQARAAGHVEQLMERVSDRVEQIRSAGAEQRRGNDVVMRGAIVMREVAQQTQRTTEEQSSGAGRIRDSMENVRDVVEHIHTALQQQGEACRSAVALLEDVFQRTHSNDESAEQLRAGAQAMQLQAEGLRDDIQRFRIDSVDESSTVGERNT